MNKQYIIVFASCPLSHPFPLAVPGILPFPFLSLSFSPCPGGLHLFWLSPSLILVHGSALWAWDSFQRTTESQKSCTGAEILQKREFWMQRGACGIRKPDLICLHLPVSNLSPSSRKSLQICAEWFSLHSISLVTFFDTCIIMLRILAFSLLLPIKCKLSEGRTYMPFYLFIL